MAARESEGQDVRRLRLSDALELAERKGFDALLAEAAVEGARGDLTQVRHLPNPQFSGAYLHSTSVPVPTGETTARGYALAVGDQGAVEGIASGKRGLRIRAAEAALASAQSNRSDALRIFRFQVAQVYWSVLLAEASERVSLDVARSFQQTFELVGVRRQYGAVSEVDLARVETAKLEAEQSVTSVKAQVKQARALLGEILGGEPMDDVELDGSLEAAIPEWPEGRGRDSLQAEALVQRPDVVAARANLERAEAALDLARRQRVPDVTVSAGYSRQGPDIAPVTPPTLSLGAAFELPIFSQRQGEVARAESERVSAKIGLDRAAAKATMDVLAAWAVLEAAREQLERMRDRLLVRARQARELVRYQYRAGAVSLLDLLDAERTALAVELEHEQDLYGLRVAVAGLEAATGRSVTP